MNTSAMYKSEENREDRIRELVDFMREELEHRQYSFSMPREDILTVLNRLLAWAQDPGTPDAAIEK